MEIIGIDLSGPGSPERTAIARFSAGRSELHSLSLTVGADDAEVLGLVPSGPCIIGIDAPLSYSTSGGSRTSDRRLRKAVIAAGLHSGSVMAPSAPRMAYLTLRGVALTRLLHTVHPDAKIVEVHPTAALALRGAPIEAVRSFKKSPAARSEILTWFERSGVRKVGAAAAESDHALAACAAALAAWKWEVGDSAWIHKSEPPIHPFDFAC